MLTTVYHIYVPTTLPQALKGYLANQDNSHDQGESCVVIGQWEAKPGKPGKWDNGAIFEERTPAEEEAMITPSRRRTTPGRLKSSTHPGPSCSSISGSSTRNSERNKEKIGDSSDSVLVVNILGVASPNFDPVATSSSPAQIIGTIQFSGKPKPDLTSRSYASLVVHFQYTPNSDNHIKPTGVAWKGQYLPVDEDRIIFFEYDPLEFQQWKIPDGYPLGVPQVFLNGLTLFQGNYLENLPCIPAFPVVPPDHQNLGDCFESSPLLPYLNAIPGVDFLSQRSAGLQQISHKVSILTGTILGTYHYLPILNFLFLLAVDSLIGYLATCYLQQFPNMLGLLHTTVEQMLLRLNHLLNWLRGAPAGLKLNANLNSLYWRFFSYHIHLWANYIGILEPVFAVILNTIQYMGILGATVQIGLFKDLLSLATFHVYCLYIYATRLFSLQTDAIKALCRVFLGKKYNPLRQRIDSVHLTTPELFLSSFAFVILIFVLPTTMVYYTGFVFLRLPVLLVERILEYGITSYNKLPFLSWLLVYLKSPRVADEIYLVSKADSNASIRSFRLSLQSTRTLFTPPDVGGCIKDIVGSVVDGTVLKN